MALAQSSCVFWLISAPADGSKENTWKQLAAKTTHENDLSVNYKLEIPDLRVGTLDSLMSLSDDLGKLDQYVEAVTHKTEREFREHAKGAEAPLIQQTPVDHYVARFQWDEARYPVKSTLRELVDLIQEQVARIDEELKSKMAEYNTLKSNLGAITRKTTGNLNTRGIADIVGKAPKDTIIETENLTTLFVVVPKHNYKDWNAKYETLADFVVPRSSKIIHEDQEFGLFRVHLFKRVAEQFKNKAREMRFNVREYAHDPEEFAREQEEWRRLETELERAWSAIVRWCRTGYSECFTAWMHLKAIRVFVESVLRYGLPEKVNFQAMLLKPHKRCENKLRKVLGEHYGHLQSKTYTDVDDTTGESFYPYVSLSINVFAPTQ